MHVYLMQINDNDTSMVTSSDGLIEYATKKVECVPCDAGIMLLH